MTRTERITQLLISHLGPLHHLEVINESSSHNVPAHSETHFKVSIVCQGFEGLSKVEQHRLVNQALAAEFDLGLHALSLRTYTPEIWERLAHPSFQSPQCSGGSSSKHQDPS